MYAFKQINSEAEFKRSFEFLARHWWIHNFPVTKILKNKCLEKIPDDWLLYLQNISIAELNTLPLCNTREFLKNPSWPPSLQEFFSEASLSLNHAQYQEGKAIDIDCSMARGMSVKKLHEVSRMAPLVDDIVRQGNCNLILDIGSGLGYLAHVLHKVYGHRVVGLETSESHLTSAEHRAVNQGITCSGFKSVKFNLTQDADCMERLEKLIEELATSLQVSCSHVTQESKGQLPGAELTDSKLEPRVCLIGLHCCGDLSSAVLSMFNAVSCVRALCCVCCCYHKMAYSEGCFLNFPMSQMAKIQYIEVKHIHPNWHVSPYTLRIGAQQTRGSWENQNRADHETHTRHVAFRALLEMLEYEDSKDLRQRVRKSDFSSFTAFLDTCFPLQESVKNATYRAKLIDLHKEHEKLFDLIEVFTCFQVILQPLIETMVYRDRVQWLLEKGHSDVQVVSVFDDKISPRNLAIVANKR
ncbi:unnamed protein product [Lymnaea stagnalis]|uniref:Methyltransferase domain-containing protein n=1 Tax=Lymnaea stagnalis TaxID=6523 RepID=A0AAV2IK58_LYMST